MNVGHEVFNDCGVIGKVDTLAGGPIDLQFAGIGTPLVTTINGLAGPSTLYCNIAPPFQAQTKVTFAYPLPWKSNLSVAFQNIPGKQITAGYNVPSSAIAPSLGRPLAAGPNTTANVQLIAPGTLYGPGLNQLDVRLAKTFSLGGSRRIQPPVRHVQSAQLGRDPRVQPDVRPELAESDGQRGGPDVQVRAAGGLVGKGSRNKDRLHEITSRAPFTAGLVIALLPPWGQLWRHRRMHRGGPRSSLADLGGT